MPAFTERRTALNGLAATPTLPDRSAEVIFTIGSRRIASMGSTFAEKAFYGLDAVTTNPAKSGRASGSASRGMRTGFCDFIFGTVRSSAVQDRS